MKILLIIPPFSEEERYGKLSAVGTLYPPLGLAYIAAVAEKLGHDVKVIESEAFGYSYEDIRQIFLDFDPEIVGMQTFLNTIDRCYKVAGMVKEAKPDVKVVLGGVQVTICPENSIKNKWIDFIVFGEGEIVFENLLVALEKGSNFHAVDGLIWKKNGQAITNKPQGLIPDLDTILLPALHLFPMNRYHSSSQLRGKRTMNIMSSRGCPYRCAYCTSHMTFGKTFRYHSAARVIQEIKRLVNEYGADGIQFYDETFTLHKKRIIELCDAFMTSKTVQVPWACFTRVNCVDEDLLNKMKEAGCYQIFYGVESGVQRLLDLIQKDITLEKTKKAFSLTRKTGIESLASLMVGFPTETIEEARKTIDFTIEIDPDYAQWQKVTPFPGTKLYDIALKHGKLLTRDWTKFTAWNETVYLTDGWTKEDLLMMEKEAFRRFYLRPKYLIRWLLRAGKLPPNKIFNLLITGIKKFFS